MSNYKGTEPVAHVVAIEPMTGIARVRFKHLQNGRLPFDILDPLYVNQADDLDVVDAQCFRFLVSALVADIEGEEMTPQQKILKASMSQANPLTLDIVRGMCISAMWTE